MTPLTGLGPLLHLPTCSQGHINNLRKVIKRMNENEGTFVTEALRFERDVDQTIEG